VDCTKTSPKRVYRRRQPEKSVLYRALAQHFESFLLRYEQRFEKSFGYLRAIVRDTVYRFLDCGILESGFARARCKACGYEFVVGLSCKARCLCPSCHKKRELLWAHWAGEQLLEDVPHRQVVFSIPKRLRIFFRYDRKLLGELAGCAWRALRLYFQIYFDRDDIVAGAIGFIATAGEMLNFHPHIHALITDGGFLKDGTFRHMLYWDTDKLEELFRAEVFRLLLEKELIGRDTVNNMLSWNHSGFSADASVRVETIADAVRIGRYMIRSPLVLERLNWDDERGEVTYKARPKRSKGPSGGIARWDVLEFIARATDHIPETGQQLIRNWGYYSNASRAKRRRESGLPNSTHDNQNDDHEQDRSDGHRQRRLSWAKMIQKVYEIDPLLCPFCGGEVKILSFIIKPRTIRKILDAMDLPSQKPVPLAHSPPLFRNTTYVPL
jgi:hypothetical protein